MAYRLHSVVLQNCLLTFDDICRLLLRGVVRTHLDNLDNGRLPSVSQTV